MSGWIRNNKDRIQIKLQVVVIEFVIGLKPETLLSLEHFILVKEKDKVLRPEVWITIQLSGFSVNVDYLYR